MVGRVDAVQAAADARRGAEVGDRGRRHEVHAVAVRAGSGNAAEVADHARQQAATGDQRVAGVDDDLAGMRAGSVPTSMRPLAAAVRTPSPVMVRLPGAVSGAGHAEPAGSRHIDRGGGAERVGAGHPPVRIGIDIERFEAGELAADAGDEPDRQAGAERQRVDAGAALHGADGDRAAAAGGTGCRRRCRTAPPPCHRIWCRHR